MNAIAAPRATLQAWLPGLVLAPSFALILVFVYGFILFTGVLSLTGSKILPDLSSWVGLNNYVRLFNHPNWITSLKNLAIFGTLYIGVSSNRAEGRRARACLGVVTFATPPCIVAHLPNQFPPKHTAGHNLGRYGDHRRHHSPENRRQHPACQTRSQLDPSLGEQHRPHQPK